MNISYTLYSSVEDKKMINELINLINQYEKIGEELNKVKEFMVKSATEAKEKNSSWMRALTGLQLNGVDTFNKSIETINAITVEDVQNFMKEVNKQGNHRVVILDPAQ
jgi:predicted Zn-dependent peptidase